VDPEQGHYSAQDVLKTCRWWSGSEGDWWQGWGSFFYAIDDFMALAWVGSGGGAGVLPLSGGEIHGGEVSWGKAWGGSVTVLWYWYKLCDSIEPDIIEF
jgi:hypothetical protein